MLIKQEIETSKTNIALAPPLKFNGTNGLKTPESGTAQQTAIIEANPKQRLMICEAMIDLSAAYCNVSSKELRQAGRCVQSISRVRQIAMYVTHTGLGLTMTDVGKGFCRDRTTVMHACHQIEDFRDDDEFDAVVEQFNRISVAAFSNLMGGYAHG